MCIGKEYPDQWNKESAIPINGLRTHQKSSKSENGWKCEETDFRVPPRNNY